MMRNKMITFCILLMRKRMVMPEEIPVEECSNFSAMNRGNIPFDIHSP